MSHDHWVTTNTSYSNGTFSLWEEWQRLRDIKGNPCSEIVLDSTTVTKAPLKIKLGIKRVIFNDPATIIYWEDGTKTVVKVQDGEVFDKEKGFAMAVLKKMFGNEGNYYNEIRKWVE